MIVYGAEPGSPSGEALRLLASWTASDPAATGRDEQPDRRGYVQHR
jgi:hypothetical protein